MQTVFFAAIPVFTISMLIEFWMVHRRGLGEYETVDTRTNLGMGLISLAVGLAGDILLVVCVAALNAVVPWSVPEAAWWSLPLAIVAVDFAIYWSHRVHHEVRFFWAAHVNHHSSRRYNLSVALRQSWTEHFTGMPFYIALGLLGLSPKLILIAFVINLVYQFFTHTEQVDRLWRPIEWVFNTPSHHRVHHATNVAYLDRNYGGIFIIWDRLFGTFQAEGGLSRCTWRMGFELPIRQRTEFCPCSRVHQAGLQARTGSRRPRADSKWFAENAFLLVAGGIDPGAVHRRPGGAIFVPTTIGLAVGPMAIVGQPTVVPPPFALFFSVIGAEPPPLVAKFGAQSHGQCHRIHPGQAATMGLTRVGCRGPVQRPVIETEPSIAQLNGLPQTLEGPIGRCVA